MKKILSIIAISLFICCNIGVQGFSKGNNDLQMQISAGDYFRFINVDDPNDSCTINVVCRTSKNKEIQLSIQRFLEIYLDKLPILKQLLNI